MYLILPTKQADAPFSGVVPRSGYLGAISLLLQRVHPRTYHCVRLFTVCITYQG
jgi:hypothetical protein